MSPTEHATAPRRLAALTAAFAAAVALAGCETPKPPVAPPPPAPVVVVPVVHCDPPREPEDLAARHLLATQERLVALNTADLIAEAQRVPDATAVEGQMDQALALGMTHNAGDIVRAMGLLDQVLHNNTAAADPYRGLARLLFFRYGEQRRAEEQVDRLNQQLRDAQRDSQRKLDQLNDKLEALKAIERSMNRSGTPSGSPGR
jgi:hypothetical protein